MALELRSEFYFKNFELLAPLLCYKPHMRSLLAFSFPLLFASAMVAQDSIRWQAIQEADKRGRSIELLGEVDDQYYALITSGKDRILEIHRESESKKATKTLEMPVVQGEALDFKELLLHQTGFWLFTEGILKEINAKVFYATPLDFNGNPTDLPVELDRIEMASRSKKALFGTSLSSNKQLLLVFRDSPYQNKSNDRLQFRVFGPDLSKLWEKQLKLPYEEEIFELADYSIDNRGKVYMLSGLGADDLASQAMDLRTREARSILLTYDPAINKMKEFDVSLKDKWVMAMGLDFAENGDAIIAGFYSRDQFFSIGGTFYFRMNSKENRIISGGLNPFPTEFLEQFMSSRRAQRASELDRFKLNQMWIQEDGSCYLLGEQRYVKERIATDIGSGRQRITNDYIFNDAIVLKLDSAGRSAWNVRIPKEQVSVDDGGPYSSYAAGLVNDTVYVFFNDHPDNLELMKTNPDRNLKNFRSFGKGVISVVSIDPSGKTERKILSDSRVEEAIFKPRIFLFDEDKMWLYAVYRRNYAFGFWP